MDSCAKFDDAIWQAAETGAMSSELADHLAHCTHCRASHERWLGALRGLTALRTVQAPDPTAAVYARLQRPARLPRLLAACTGALALACLALLVWHANWSIHQATLPLSMPPLRRTTTPVSTPVPLPEPPKRDVVAIRKMAVARPTHRRHRPRRSVPPQPATRTVEDLLAQTCRQHTVIDPNFRPPDAMPCTRSADPTYCALTLPEPHTLREPSATTGLE